MNWPRGLFRLWLIFSVAWLIVVYAVPFSTDQIVLAKPDTITVHWGSEELKYPSSYTKDQVRDDLENRIEKDHEEREAQFRNMTQEQRAECAALPPTTLFTKMSPLCFNFITHADKLVAPTGWEAQLRYPPRTVLEELRQYAALAIGPPLVLLLAGWATLWALRGFRRRA